MGKTHIFKINIQIYWKTQYVGQVPFPKTTHKTTTNTQHQNQQTFEDNDEHTLLSKEQLSGIIINIPNEGFIQKSKENTREKQQTQKQQRFVNYFG